MFQYAITITIAAPTPEELALRVDTVRLAASQSGIQLAIARFQQWEGYLESLPLGRAELGLLLDSSGQALAMGLPTATPACGAAAGCRSFGVSIRAPARQSSTTVGPPPTRTP